MGWRTGCVSAQPSLFQARKLGNRVVRVVARSPSFLRGRRLCGRKLAATNSRSRAWRQATRMGLFGLGVPELVVIAGVAALLFGPKKLPELGKSLGKTLKGFQVAAKEFETELKSAAGEEDEEKTTKTDEQDRAEGATSEAQRE